MKKKEPVCGHDDGGGPAFSYCSRARAEVPYRSLPLRRTQRAFLIQRAGPLHHYILRAGGWRT
jgi:hypothetical protein